jgi:hypothetical protein
MIGVLNDDLSICLKHENGTECETKLEEDYSSRIINGYFIKDDMEFGIIYIAVTGNKEYFITKIQDKNNEIVIKLKPEELKNIKLPNLPI